jgi:hypothetical protein
MLKPDRRQIKNLVKRDITVSQTGFLALSTILSDVSGTRRSRPQRNIVRGKRKGQISPRWSRDVVDLL